MNKFALLFCSVLTCASTMAHAGVSIGGTRVIYNEGKKEVALNVTNSGEESYLIQSWVEDPTSAVKKAPFIITPPLFRLDGNQDNILRIVRTGGQLPADTEKLFWLSIKTIPYAAKKDNTLQLAIKTKIKLIFRPDSLSEHTPEDVTEKLTWAIHGNQLTVNNPTNYYMNFNFILINGIKVENPTYASPHASQTYSLPRGSSAGRIEWALISDFGGAGKTHSSKV
ncbi:fimbrial biogenesis chaperone [Lelliottia amnigena]|uniref:fimbrial biogenesis chaperone n=1 Tax=Lelliottia amnigena TaxID=61646 RepID=UPI004056CEB2